MKVKNKIFTGVRLERWFVVAVLMTLYDVVAVNASYFCALWLRFDCTYSKIPETYLHAWISFMPFYTLFCIIVFQLFKMYNSMWRYASFEELSRVIGTTVITTLFHGVGITLFFCKMPVFYYGFGAMLQFFMLLAVRFSYRFVLLERRRSQNFRNREELSNVMLIGAGSAGQMILRDIHRASEVSERVCCFIDDDPQKWGMSIDGVPIVGGREDILASVEKYNIKKIYLTLPSAQPLERRDILDICKETDCELKSLPGIYQLVNGEVSVAKLKAVEPEDLLGRDPIKVNMDAVFKQIKGKVILVTGGGGSIGSELCRQIAAHNPRRLIIFDVYENNAYDIQQELRKKYPKLDLVVLIGSVRDSRKLSQVFAAYRPQIVYHAAAHKHVPLMEDSPCESIKNNAIGTYKTAYAAMLNGCERFVLISTDKAVNPTNIMGASKRLCEMVIQTFDRMIKEGRADKLPRLFVHAEDEGDNIDTIRPFPAEIHTEYVAVRFGNVLGSNGSVIPLFKKQIAAGGPVTVTDPDIIRYFMTIPEAVSLVLTAGAHAEGGEIFILDMGDPVKIDDLARNLIKLSGLRPDVDIQVKYTGLRMGEKLYEEKLMSEEGIKSTPNKLIHIGSPIPFDADRFLEQLDELMHAAYDEREDICDLVASIVPTYHPANGAAASYPNQIERKRAEDMRQSDADRKHSSEKKVKIALF
jgi:FlaA1/EpsC-like NDP-sugar epimerase